MKDDYVVFEAVTPKAIGDVKEAIREIRRANRERAEFEKDVAERLGAVKVATIGQGKGYALAGFALAGVPPKGWKRITNIQAPISFYQPEKGTRDAARMASCTPAISIEGVPNSIYLDRSGSRPTIRMVSPESKSGAYLVRIPRCAGIDSLPGFVSQVQKTQEVHCESIRSRKPV